MNRRLFAFSFFIFPPSSRVLMHANNYGHYHGLCHDKFTKTPRRGRVETLLPLLPAFYAILTHSRAKSSTGLCYSSVVYPTSARVLAGTELLTCVYLPTAPRARRLVNCISQCTRWGNVYAPATVYRVILVPSHGPAVVVCPPPHSSQCF